MIKAGKSFLKEFIHHMNSLDLTFYYDSECWIHNVKFSRKYEKGQEGN